jgi:hypothetical protein
MTLRSFAVGLAAAAALGLSSTPASAQTFFQNSTGLASPAQTLTFSEVVLAPSALVGNAYAGFGVTFGPGVTYDPLGAGGPNQSAPTLGNFTFDPQTGFSPGSSPVLISFSATQTEAAFSLITNDGSTLFEALLGGNVVASQSANTDLAQVNNFFGFTGGQFDQIRISPGGDNNRMLLDNLQTGSSRAGVVPEPVSLALFLPGVAAFGLMRGRRRRGDS